MLAAAGEDVKSNVYNTQLYGIKGNSSLVDSAVVSPDAVVSSQLQIKKKQYTTESSH